LRTRNFISSTQTFPARMRVLLWCTIMTACGTPAPPAPTAPASLRLDSTPFAFSPAPHRYQAVTHRLTLTDVQGQTARTTTHLAYEMTVAVRGTVSDRSVLAVLDSVLRAEGQGLGQATPIGGTTLSGELQANGVVTVLATTPPERAMHPAVEQASTTLRLSFPHVPVAGLVPGGSWRDSTTLTREVNGSRLLIVAVTTHEATEWMPSPIDTTAPATLTVSWERSYVVSGTGEQLGQPYSLEGSGFAHGEHRLRADGAYLGTVSTDSLGAEVIVSSLGFAIPLIQTGADTIRMIGPP
jgi:hypothetical protein